MAGGFTLERPPSPREKEVLESPEVKKGLEFMSNVSFSEVEAVSVKSQVVAGTNYTVKYKVKQENGFETYVLAKVFEPLPYTNEPPEVTTAIYGVDADSPLDLI